MSARQVDSVTPAAGLTPAAARDGSDAARFAREPIDGAGEMPAAFVQRKVEVGAADDPLEREADRAAEEVMRMPEGLGAQRACTPCAEERESVRRKPFEAVMRRCSACAAKVNGPEHLPASFVRRRAVATGDSGAEAATPPLVHEALRAAGEPLDAPTRAFFEPRFGRDFAGVRVHTDAAAAYAATLIDAQAYTLGSDVAFASGRFDPRSHSGRNLLAHELAHVVQQGGADTARVVRRRPDAAAAERADAPAATPGEHPSIVMIVAYERSKLSAVATLSNGKVEAVTLTENTLSEGEYVYQRDRSAPLHYRLLNPRPGQAFIWLRKRKYDWADTVRVLIRLDPQERIAQLPPHIRNFLTTSRSGAPKATAEELVAIASAGRILETYGVTEDELSLLELAAADRRGVHGPESEEGGDPVGWALQLVEGRQAAAASASKTRDTLLEAAAKIGSAWEWRKESGAAALEEALETEVRAVATMILNATEAAIYRMDARFIGAYQRASLGPGFLGDVLQVLRADAQIKEARQALQQEEDWKPPKPPSPDEAQRRHELEEQYWKEGRSSALPDPWYAESHKLEHARRLRSRRNELNELVRKKTSAGLQLGSLPHASAERLLGAKSMSDAQRILRDMLFDGRTAVRDARRRLDDGKALFGADIVIATEKALLGVKPTDPLDRIIDDIVRDRTAPSVWERILNVVSLVVMFIPGGIGVAIRAALSTVQAVRSVENYAEQATYYRGGLLSTEPSGGALVTELVITAGGVVLDKATAAKVASRGKVLDLTEHAPVAHVPPQGIPEIAPDVVPEPLPTGGAPDVPATAGGAPDAPGTSTGGGGEPVPESEMRGVQLEDEPHSIEIRPTEVPVKATMAEVTALQNTERSLLSRRPDLVRNVATLRREERGLWSQLTKRDELLKGSKLTAAGRETVENDIEKLVKALDEKDAAIAKAQAELGNADEELAHVRTRLANEGVVPPGQPAQLAAGKLREAEVGEAFSLGPQNTERMRDPAPGGRDFVPDFIDGNPDELVWGDAYHFREVKDWADMSDTGNLAAMLDYVENTTGSELTIYFRSNTYMSGPLTARIEALRQAQRVHLVPFAGL